MYQQHGYMTSEKMSFSDRKLGSPEKAASFWNTLWRNGDARRKSYATVLNQLNGGRPFEPNELVKSGQGWRCNVNFRDAQSTLEYVLVSYWRMVHDVTSLAVVTIHDDNLPSADKYEQVFQKNFDRFVEEWGSEYVRNYLLFSLNHTAFGAGTVMYPDQDSPRWEAMRFEDVVVPERTKASVDAFEVVGVRQEMTISELWERIRTPEAKTASESRGWSVSAIRKVLWDAMHKNQKPDNDDYARIEDEIRNNSLACSAEAGSIDVVHLFTREFDGKICRVILPIGQDHEVYLFDDYTVPKRFTKMSEALYTVFFEAGNGLFYGSKGFGVKNYGLSLTLNRLKSRAVDRTLIDGLNFRDLEEGRESYPITNVGPFTFLPRGVEQVPSYPTGKSILETISMIEMGQMGNNARFRDQSQQVAKVDTATQANLLAGIQSQIDTAGATLYLTQLARGIYSEQFRRLRRKGNTDPDAKLFRKRCLKEMPEEVFYDAEISVRTGADPSLSSAQLRASVAGQAMQMMTNRNIDDRRATEMWVANSLGPNAVKRLLVPEEELDDPQSIRAAMLENAALGDGMPIPVSRHDKHEIHAEVHIGAGEQITQAFQERGTMDPSSLAVFQTLIPHVDQHMAYLKADKLKQALFQELNPRWTQLKAIAEGMFAQVQKMEEAAAGADPAGNAARQGDPRQVLAGN